MEEVGSLSLCVDFVLHTTFGGAQRADARMIESGVSEMVPRFFQSATVK